MQNEMNSTNYNNDTAYNNSNFNNTEANGSDYGKLLFGAFAGAVAGAVAVLIMDKGSRSNVSSGAPA